VDDAARLMRQVRDDPELARSRAAAAHRDIRRHYSEACRGQAMQQRLSQAAAALRRKDQARTQPGLPRSKPALVAPIVPPMDLGDSSHGRIGVFAKRGMNVLMRYHNHYQGEVNLAFARFMRDLLADHEEQASLLAATRQHVATVDAKLARLAGDVARLDGYFDARPYMAFDAYGASGDLRKPMGYSSAESDGEVPEFGDIFRGPEDFIAERQRAYLRFFKGMSSVVDLGCGRGEFLRLLCDIGINAVGVELDPLLVEHCRERGLRVEPGDAYEYLKGVAEASLDVVFSAQFIEHVDSHRLDELLELSLSRLRDGGLFIAETPNPESYLAQKAFYVDLTHQRPIFPQVLLHLCQTAGYSSARIFYPTAGGFTQMNYRDAGEYAVIAVK
jgi:SAM-dependent methyltransferase